MKRALLGADNVLTGYAEPTGAPGEILVPDDCDLLPGRYRWDGKAFMPNVPGPEQVLEQMDTLRAVARGFMAIRDGKPLPQETLDWLRAYETSFDNRG